MSNVGFQQLWVAGSRMYFQRDPVGGVVQPWVDMGVMDVVSPGFEVEEITCEDPDGGTRVPIDTQITSLAESYEATFKNLNQDNLALVFLANPAAAIGQTADALFIKHRAQSGRLVKLIDADYDLAVDPGEPIFNVTSIAGVADGNTTSGAGSQPVAKQSVDSIASQVITIAGVDLTAELKSGDKIVLCGLDVPADDGVYTLSADAVLNVSDTEITVTETITDQGSAGGFMRPTTLIEDVDWEVVDLERGIIRMVDGGNLTADSDIHVCITPVALTGARRLLPLTLTGQLRGKAIVVWGRNRNSQQSARVCEVSVTPGTPNFQVEDYSTITLNFTVVADISADEPAGRLDYFLGDLPNLS